MRISVKIQLSFIIIFVVILPVFASLLIGYNFRSTLDNEIENSRDSFVTIRTSLNMSLITARSDSYEEVLYDTSEMLELRTGESLTLMSKDGDVLFGHMFDDKSIAQVIEEKDNIHLSRIGDSVYLLAMGQLLYGNQEYIFIQERDITHIFLQKDILLRYYTFIYTFLLVLACAIALLLTRKLTSSIRALKRTVKSYEQGNFENRTQIATKDEIGDLADGINMMATTIEDKIRQLETSAVQKDMFMSSFAHEIKTPLTSVIGYAELLKSKSISTEMTKEVAEYIWNESMRLEALSLKLMELFMLRKKEFQLIQIQTEEIKQDLISTLSAALKGTGIDLNIYLEDAYVDIEPDLFKTLIINLVDNARKADSKNISITGEIVEDGYYFTVKDDGCGIPENELENITEPFYMVDKARSRAKHGAGLGLSLAKQIAEIHHSELKFCSTQGVGTCVSLTIAGGGRYEE